MVKTEALEEKVFHLEGKLEDTRSKLLDLATMGALIASILDLEKILSVVMEMAVRTVDGEVGLIQLYDRGELTSKLTWGVDDAVIKSIAYKDEQDISSYCFNKQEAVIINDFVSRLDFGPTVTRLMARPIKSRAKCHGTVVVINKTTGDEFTEEDRVNLEMLINFAAVAIDNALLMEESLQKQRIEQELTIAKQIQETILPGNEIEIEGVEIGHLYRPARYVGGDFYDVIIVGEDSFVLVIGDVSNKGVPAAMLMSATMAIIRSQLMKSPEIGPAELMNNLNNVLCNGIIKSHDMFVTLFIARIDLRAGEANYCNAGHMPPLYWSSDQDKLVELRSGGTFVGQFPDMIFKMGTIPISAGDRFLAYTDGVTEAEDSQKRQFGIERLRQAFLKKGEMSARRFCAFIADSVDRFVESPDKEPFDDLTLLAVKIRRDVQ
ncbi:MAG: SpoIIE family protein phosphatase [Candidatus Zixiibacteriota bacterium]|nr:MAG: SpoIIE family protein phosphatase [candidate division Zixibacteria bacterium]